MKFSMKRYLKFVNGGFAESNGMAPNRSVLCMQNSIDIFFLFSDCIDKLKSTSALVKNYSNIFSGVKDVSLFNFF